MLGKKKELGRGAFGEMYVYLQPAAKPCCCRRLQISTHLTKFTSRNFFFAPSIMSCIHITVARYLAAELVSLCDFCFF